MAHNGPVRQPSLGSLVKQDAVLLQVGPSNDAAEHNCAALLPTAPRPNPLSGTQALHTSALPGATEDAVLIRTIHAGQHCDRNPAPFIMTS